MAGTIQTRPQLEDAFSAGKIPSAADYANLFGSFYHKSDTIGGASSDDIVIINLTADDYSNFTGYGNGQSISNYYGGKYEKVEIADVIKTWLQNHTASNEEYETKYSAAKVAIVRNESFLNTHDNSPVYIESKGGTVTIDSGNATEEDVITAIPSGACVMFVKQPGYNSDNAPWSVIDRPISITDYELSQLAQNDTSGGGYGS